jgi:hypothetical protein
MLNRSNIDLVGNTTQGQNLGGGAEIYKCKSGGNNLQYRTILSTGSSIQIFQSGDKILISGATGGGSGTITGGTNGLSISNKNIILGGNLCQSTNIGATGYIFNITGSSSEFRFQGTDSLGHWCAQNNCIDLQGTYLTISSSGNTLNIGDVQTTYTSHDGAGIKYATDYSATFTARSLIDKGYFAARSGGTSYWNRTGTVLCPTTVGDCIRMSNNSCILWNSTSVCIYAASGASSCLLNMKSGSYGYLISSTGIMTLTNTQINIGSTMNIFPASNLINGTTGQPLLLQGGNDSGALTAGCMAICGGEQVGGGGGGGGCVHICGGRSCCGIGGSVYITPGIRICTSTYGNIYICRLPAKSVSEICTVYIGADGKLATSTAIILSSGSTASHPNNSIFYSTDSAKLVYKDVTGGTHNLY